MARWLRDAETGELFQEGELDPNSYESAGDWQTIAPEEPRAPQSQFPTWLTSGIGTSIPARSLASVAKGGASLEQLLGDLASNLPGLENNALQRDALLNRQMAEDLVNQARQENKVEPGSWQDIGGAVAGEILPSLGTLGYGLARGAGKAALSVAPALLPSATKYGDLTEQGVGGGEAGLAALGSLGMNSLLNRFDVGAALNPAVSTARRIGQTALTGGATNAVGTYGDALIDKQVDAPQNRDQFMQNLLTSAAAGAATGAGFGAMASLKPSLDVQAPEGQGIDDMLAQMQSDSPSANQFTEAITPQDVSPIFNDPDVSAVEKQATGFISNITPKPESKNIQIDGESAFPESPLSLSKQQPEAAKQVQQQPVFDENSRESNLVDVPVYSTLDTVQLLKDVVTQEVPVAKLKLSAEVPQWKTGANEKGETYQIEGDLSRTDVGPMQVWERANGDLEVISGRHRLGKYQREEAQTAPAQIHREVDGFTREMAKLLDIELNIRDGRGSIGDFATYFRGQKGQMPEEVARQRSLLNTTKGQLGYNIGAKASDDVWAAWKNQDLSDRMASAIANAAPLDAPLQAEGIRLAKAGRTIYEVAGAIEMTRDLQNKVKTSGDQGVLFGNQQDFQHANDVHAEIMAVKKEAKEKILDEVRSFEAAAKRPELAEKRLNFKGRTADQLLAEADRLKFEAAKYDELKLWPDKEAEVRRLAEQRLQNGDSERAGTVRRFSQRRGVPVSSAEAGFIDLSALADFIRNRQARKQAEKLPDYQDWSTTNKRYADGSWGRVWEWMDTTRRKEPASAAFIDGQWKIPQDTHAIVWDADEILQPYKNPDLSAKERQGVNNYLQAARIRASQDGSYRISVQTMAKMGLNEKQMRAALAAKLWSDNFANQFESDAIAQAEHDARIAMLKNPFPDYKAKVAENLAAKRAKIAETFDTWRKSNYVPFDRYGDHYVNVFSPDGKLLARQQFESKSDPGIKKAISHYRQLATQPGDFAGARVEYGKAPPPEKLQNLGVNRDILDILGEGPSDQAIQGFSRHLKNAKLIPGYNPDLNRAIADYTVGAARLLAFRRANRVADIELATSLAGDDKINLRNKLVAFKDSLNKPDSGMSRAVNEYFNAAYIGGNARVPIADQLGFYQMQTMVLSKYLKGLDPERVEFKTYGNLAKYYFGRGIDADMSVGIKEAQRKGLIPTDTFKSYLRARRGPSDVMQAMSTVKDAYFSLKSLSERTVDAGAFMSGWEAWKKLPAETKKTVSQQQFAENMIREMKAVPSKYELPANALFSSPVGRLATKFRLYQVKLAKTIAETPMPGKLRGALRMFLTVGVSGLPLIGKEAFNLSRGLGVEPEDKLRKMVGGYGPAVMYGPLSALTGIDFSGTAGYGEVFSSQAANPFSKMALGVAGAPFEAGLKALQYAERGQGKKALAQIPVSNLLSNYLNQSDWADRGVVTMGGQAVIPRDEVRGVDRLKKLAGLQPLAVKEAMVKESRFKQAEAKAKDNDFINQRLGEALGLGKMDDARAVIREAMKKGLQLNMGSVKKAIGKIRGQRPTPPKRARQEIARIDPLYD